MKAFKKEEIDQTDLLVDRDRIPRFLVAIMTPIFVMLFAWWLGKFVSEFFHLWEAVGVTAALVLCGLTLPWLKSKSIIHNGAVNAFVTIDPLVSFMGGQNPLVTYGPGTHFSYWWETRVGANNVDLSEVSVNYTVEVQCKDGTVEISFSARLRPNIKELPIFLAGAGSLAADLGDLIATKIIQMVAPMEVLAVLKDVAAINAMLLEFKHGPNQEDTAEEFEGRFGIFTGDVTVGKILPSKEIRETMSALTESAVIDQMVARSFGKETMDEVIKAKIDTEEVNRRRTQAMAMSGNLQGMDLKESTFNFRVQGLKDIDPELVKALAAAGPALAAFMAANKSSNSGGNPKNAGNPRPKKGA